MIAMLKDSMILQPVERGGRVCEGGSVNEKKNFKPKRLNSSKYIFLINRIIRGES